MTARPHVKLMISHLASEKNALGQPVGLEVPNWQAPPRPSREPMDGRYCRVEPLDVARHGADLFDAYATDVEGRNWSYLPYGPFEDVAALKDWLAVVAKSDDPFFHTIVSAETGKAVGVASYLRINPASGSIEVGHIHFSPLLQRTPAATETMYLMMRRAFELGYRRYEWKCNALNGPSREAALRLGLSYEGIFRQQLVVKGRNRDTAWYAAIDSEWPALKLAFEDWLSPENFDPDGAPRTSLAERIRPLLVAIG